MVRTQIQLTEAQAAALKKLAARQGRSMAELIRIGVDVLLRSAPPGREEQKRRALAASGRFRSGLRDLSRRHDRYLAKAFR